jgi:tetratricopeptide (TPR) repeat protein
MSEKYESIEVLEYKNNELIQSIKNKDLKKRVLSIIDKIFQRKDELWRYIKYPYMVDHGEIHTRNVMDLLTRFSSFSQPKLLNELSDMEKFCLIFAVWFHDIGGSGLPEVNEKFLEDFLYTRGEHPWVGEEIFIEMASSFGFSEEETHIIEEVIPAHSSKEKIDKLPKEISLNNQRVRPRLLASILSFMDACDTQQRRVRGDKGVKRALKEIEAREKKEKKNLEEKKRLYERLKHQFEKEEISKLKKEIKLYEAKLNFYKETPKHFYKHLSVKEVYFTPESVILEPNYVMRKVYPEGKPFMEYFNLALEDIRKEFERVKGYFNEYGITIREIRACNERDDMEELKKQLLKGRRIIIEHENFSLLTSSEELYDVISDPKFIEYPIPKEEWEIKRKKNIIKIPQELIESTLSKLKNAKILLLTGPEKVGKTTYMIYLVDEILKGNFGEWQVVIFLPSILEAEELDEVLENVKSHLYTSFQSQNALFVVDRLRSDESFENFKEKCEKLFEEVSNQKQWKLIATIRSDEKSDLEKTFREEKIDKWRRWRISEEDLSSFLRNTNFLKDVFRSYLEFKNIPINFAEFEESMDILLQKSERIIGLGVNLIECVLERHADFSKQSMENAPYGNGYVWDYIQRDYYKKGDKVIPFIFLFLGRERYSVTKEFIDFIAGWGIKTLNDGKFAEDVWRRVHNLADPIMEINFEGINEYRLRNDWRESIKEGLKSYAQEESFREIKEVFRDINDIDFDLLIIRIIEEISSQQEKLSPFDGKNWLITGDIAKIWGLEGVGFETKLKALTLATRFFLINSREEITSINVWRFLKKTLSFLWRRAFHETKSTLPEKYYNLAIEFYKKASLLDKEDYWLLWSLSEYMKLIDPIEALICCIEAAKRENTSGAYARAISIIEEQFKDNKINVSLRLKEKHYQHLKYELLELQKEMALNSIECYTGDSRNFYQLGKVLGEIGNYLLEEGSYIGSRDIFSKAIQAYEKSLELLNRGLFRGDEESKKLYVSYIRLKIIATLRKRADANLYNEQFERAKEDLEEALKEAKAIGDAEVIKEISSQLNKLNELKYDIEYNLSFTLYNELSKFSKKLENINQKKYSLEDYSSQPQVLFSTSLKRLGPDSILKKVFLWFSHLMEFTTKEMKSEEPYVRLTLSREWYKLGSYINEHTNLKTFIAKNLHRIAKACFEISVKLDPNNFAAWYKLGWESTFYTGEHDLAIKAFNKSIEIENRVKTLFLFFINSSFESDIKAGKITDELRNEFKKNHSSLPKNCEILMIKDNEWGIPTKTGKYVIRKLGNNLAVYKESRYSYLSKIGIGKAYQAESNIPLAKKWLEEGLNECRSIYLENTPQKVIDTLVKTGESLRKLGELDENNKENFMKETLKLYEEAEGISSTKISSTGSQTKFLKMMVKLLSIHRKLIEEKKFNVNPRMSLDDVLSAELVKLLSIESLPQRLETLYNKEYAFTILGKSNKSLLKKAIEYADKILAQKPNDVFTLINKAQNLGLLNDYWKALDTIDKALRIDNKNIYAIHNKGFYLLKLENFGLAIKEFDKVLEFNPNYPSAWYNKGYAIHKLNLKLKMKEKEEEAIRCYDKAIELMNQNPELHKEELVTTLDNKGYSLIILGGYEKRAGNVKRAMEIWEEAIKECFDKVLELNPRHIRALNNKGQVLGKLRRFPEAHECLKKAFDLTLEEGLNEKEPEYFASILDNRGYIFSEEAGEKEGEKAIEFLKKALEFENESIKACSTYASAWRNKFYTLFKLDIRQTVPKDQFISDLSKVIEEGFRNVEEKIEFLSKIRKSIIYCLADAISTKENFITSKEELISLVNNFNDFLAKLNKSFEKISVEEVRKAYTQKYKAPYDIERLKKIFP